MPYDFTQQSERDRFDMDQARRWDALASVPGARAAEVTDPFIRILIDDAIAGAREACARLIDEKAGYGDGVEGEHPWAAAIRAGH